MQQFPFIKVLEYRRHLRLECRQELAAALADEQRLVNHRVGLEQAKQRQLEELGQLAASSRLSVDAAARRRYFAGQIDIELLVVDEQLLHHREQVERCRTALLQADQDLQALERLEEKHMTKEQYEFRRRTELELSDQWLAGRLASRGP